MGGKLVVPHEVNALHVAMRHDLAKQVKDVALYDAAAGYDVPSGEAVKFFELAGDVEESCGLVSVNFRAYPNGPSV